MAATKERTPLDGYSPQEERPLGGYALLLGTFLTLASAFAAWFRSSGRELPDRVDGRDLVLLVLASHKSSRVLAKDRVTSAIRAPFTRYEGDAGPGEVSDVARGTGLRRAVGELLVCPYCLGMWTSACFTASLLVLPRFTRWVATVFSVFFGADVLQIAYKRAEQEL